MHVVLQGQQTRTEAGERAADRRSYEIDASLVDTHEPDDLAILGDRANRSADVGAFEKEIQRRRSRERDAESEQARVADIDPPDLEHRQPHSNVAEVGRKKQRGEALQEVEQPAGGEKLVDRR
jgi:hypothetical protein